jgi:hypothetical protein
MSIFTLTPGLYTCPALKGYLLVLSPVRLLADGTLLGAYSLTKIDGLWEKQELTYSDSLAAGPFTKE